MEKYVGYIILAVSILVVLLVVCNSKHPVDIHFKFKDIEFKIDSKKEENK